jgi:putative membrane protein
MWGDHMMWGWGGGWGGWAGMAWYWVMHLLWWALVIAAVILLVRWGSAERRDRRGGEDSAVAILRERYARGEIDQKEFDERMRFLKGERA